MFSEKFKINARNKLTTKSLLTFFHYTRPHLEYGCEVQVLVKKNWAHRLFFSLISIPFPTEIRCLKIASL